MISNLEKFNFRELGDCYKRPFLFSGEIYINKETKESYMANCYKVGGEDE